ncbi:MAG: glutamine-hydrolyzing carbamoyl-phosphate synthase small subunit [Proteobacteria bacterium]|nr:glutamine-hydrolyzing carbamoyl-phosphate synthase small subunit [Pseudomonadota bacterium]
MSRPALLALEDGSIFEGIAFGHLTQNVVHAVGEVVFNTAMTGYQEILSDPSYTNQLVTLTYPHIGNVGVNTQDQESDGIYARGLIIKQLPLVISNWRHESSLEAYLAKHRVLGIAQIDTRRLTRLIREKGALKGCIYSSEKLTVDDKQKAVSLAREFGGLKGLDLAKVVSTQKPYVWQEKGLWSLQKPEEKPVRFKVIAYDFGIKKTILRCLHDLGCQVTVVPAQTKAQEVLSYQPDGVFLSNGPGDPEPCDYAINAIKEFLENKLPLFGICLGHQLLALAMGAKTMKMKFGHHGGNHPVRQISDNRVLITSQNHGFAVDEATIPANLVITHRSLFDNTIQGFKHAFLPAYGFQGHPEAGPGPNDARILFADFIEAMRIHGLNKKAQHKIQEMTTHA